MKRLLAIMVVIICIVIPLGSAAKEVGGGDLNFSPKNALPVVFSHEKHVNAKGRKCSNCHYQIFQMEKGSYKMDMTKMTKGDFCGTCHNGQRAFDVKDQKNCSLCHRKP
jgi:c(7)-type cytochrome triheme protein